MGCTPRRPRSWARGTRCGMRFERSPRSHPDRRDEAGKEFLVAEHVHGGCITTAPQEEQEVFGTATCGDVALRVLARDDDARALTAVRVRHDEPLALHVGAVQVDGAAEVDE